MGVHNNLGRHVFVANLMSKTQIDNNLLYQSGGEETIKWKYTDYTLKKFKPNQGLCGDCTNKSADVTSNLGDKGRSLDNISQLYHDTFGVYLDRDFNGNARVKGNSIDIGAIEKL